MIGSDCKSCPFLKERKCSLGLFSVDNGKTIISPGFCRMWRPQNWKEKNRDLDLTQLERKARSESAFKYDLIILFDNAKNTTEELKNTLSISHLETKQIIIADISKQENNRTEIINIFRDREKYTSIPVKLDILLNKDENIDQSIRRISKLCKEKYFVIIPCGKLISSQDNYKMCIEINEKDTRFIRWFFYNDCGYGIYIKQVYGILTTKYSNPFIDILSNEEISTGIMLSCYV